MADLNTQEKLAVGLMADSLSHCPLGRAHYPHSPTDYETDLVCALRATGWVPPTVSAEYIALLEAVASSTAVDAACGGITGVALTRSLAELRAWQAEHGYHHPPTPTPPPHQGAPLTHRDHRPDRWGD